jgi:DNA-binding CsgD family transcriptional regulator
VFSAGARQRGDLQGLVDGLLQLADSLVQLDRPSEAEAPAREAVAMARSSWRALLAAAMGILSEALVRVEAPDAEETLADAERLIDELDTPVTRPVLLRTRGLLLLRRGDVTGAIEALQLSAALARSWHWNIQLGRTLAVLAEATGRHGDDVLAAQVDAERIEIVERIGPEVRGLAWAHGLAGAGRKPRGRGRSSDGASAGPLSPGERQVAALIARGLTDRQIAERLVITEGTAGVHVGHILNKLGLHARREIASWAVERGIATP